MALNHQGQTHGNGCMRQHLTTHPLAIKTNGCCPLLLQVQRPLNMLGTLPAEWGSLRGLQGLDLSRSSVTGMPAAGIQPCATRLLLASSQQSFERQHHTSYPCQTALPTTTCKQASFAKDPQALCPRNGLAWTT